MNGSDYSVDFFKLKKLKNSIIQDNVLKMSQISIDFNILEWIFNLTLLFDAKTKIM